MVQPPERLPEILLFAASRDQRYYFQQLALNVKLPISVAWYKGLWAAPLGPAPDQAWLAKQVDLLVRRKRNTAAGQKRSEGFWGVFSGWNRWRIAMLYRMYHAWLKRQPAHYVGVWNGKKLRQAIMVEAARALGRQVLFFETGPLPGYSALECWGVDAASGLPREGAFYRRFSGCRIEAPVNASADDAGLPQGYVFVPFQVVEDSNIYFHSPHLRNMRELFDWLVQAVEKRPDLHIVIKPHPGCPEDYRDLYAAHPRIRFVEDMDTRQLIHGARAVVTINSTVGMEALQAGKPLVVLGDAIYHIEGLVQTATNVNELIEALDSIDKGWKPDEAVREGYLCYLQNVYALPGDAMKAPDTAHFQAVESRLRAIMERGCREALELT